MCTVVSRTSNGPRQHPQTTIPFLTHNRNPGIRNKVKNEKSPETRTRNTSTSPKTTTSCNPTSPETKPHHPLQVLPFNNYLLEAQEARYHYDAGIENLQSTGNFELKPYLMFVRLMHELEKLFNIFPNITNTQTCFTSDFSDFY
jgi:hypothetical protein